MFCYKCGSRLDPSGVCQECLRKKKAGPGMPEPGHDEAGPADRSVRAVLARELERFSELVNRFGLALAALLLASSLASLGWVVWSARDEIAALLPDRSASGPDAAESEPVGNASVAAAGHETATGAKTARAAGHAGGETQGDSAADAPPADRDGAKLTRIAKCLGVSACLNAMLDAADDPLTAAAVDAAAARLAKYAQTERGDARVARALARSARAAFNAGERDGALALLQRAAAADPSDAEIQLQLGHVTLRSGDSDLAAQALENALALDPRHSGAWVALAENHAVRGDAEHALKALLLAHAFSPRPQETIAFFERRADSIDIEAMRPLLRQAAQLLRSRNPP